MDTYNGKAMVFFEEYRQHHGKPYKNIQVI